VSGRPSDAATPVVGLTRAPRPGSPGAHEDDDYQPVFTGAARSELDEILTRYPTKMAALLPALWIVQRERGWVSEAAVAEVAAVLSVTPAHVKGVLSFYTMYHQHPVGKYFVQVCTTSPCNVCGAEDVVRAFLKHTGVGELGATSADGRFTVIEVECLGACGFATPVMINDEFIESVSAEGVAAIVDGLT
jgi:NADH-quinone oxidoreductase E subunit